MRTTAILAAVLPVIALSGCAGASQRIRFDTVKVPVSLSQSVLDRNGNIAGPDRLESLGRFEGEFGAGSICWTLVPLGRINVSDALNARVDELGGDAVVGLRCVMEEKKSLSNYVLWINMLPFWPGSVKVHVEGDVVRVAPRGGYGRTSTDGAGTESGMRFLPLSAD
jgi:hypothetical protein